MWARITRLTPPWVYWATHSSLSRQVWKLESPIRLKEKRYSDYEVTLTGTHSFLNEASWEPCTRIKLSSCLAYFNQNFWWLFWANEHETYASYLILHRKGRTRRQGWSRRSHWSPGTTRNSGHTRNNRNARLFWDGRIFQLENERINKRLTSQAAVFGASEGQRLYESDMHVILLYIVKKQTVFSSFLRQDSYIPYTKRG